MQHELRVDISVFVRSRSHTSTDLDAFIPRIDHRQSAPISMHVRTCVEIKFQAPHAIDAMLSLLDFHTAVDEALAQQLFLFLELGARQFI